MSKPKFYYVYRSAVTGRFVKAAFARANPRTTIRIQRWYRGRK